MRNSFPCIILLIKRLMALIVSDPIKVLYFLPVLMIELIKKNVLSL